MNRVMIIAEAGVNHNGSVEIAKKMVDAVKNSGADAIKFQTFKTDDLVSKTAKKAEYQLKNSDYNETQFQMIKKLEIDKAGHKEILGYCQSQGIKFLSSPFDISSIELLDELGIDTFKIPSGEIINLPYLRKLGQLNKKIILSTGMSNLGEIERALNELIKSGSDKENITVLHCNTAYPTPLEDVNLRAMVTIKNAFDVKVGYSDHTLGFEVSVAAVALGAEIIEKHFTLNREWDGPDHKASLEPEEFSELVKVIRNTEKLLGDGIKRVSVSEGKSLTAARKSLIAIKFIHAGEKFTTENLGIKRPGDGLSPVLFDEIIGKKAIKDFEEDELIVI